MHTVLLGAVHDADAVCLLYFVCIPVVEKVVDMRGADQSVESLVAGGLGGCKAVVTLAFTMSQKFTKINL